MGHHTAETLSWLSRDLLTPITVCPAEEARN